MVVSKKSAVKRVLSLMMALALVFTMWGGIPQKVLAATGFYVYTDGTIGVGSTASTSKTLLISGGLESDGYNDTTINNVVSWNKDSKTLTIKGLEFSDLETVNGMTVVMEGEIAIAMLGLESGSSVTIQMTTGATATIGAIQVTGTSKTISQAVAEGLITIKGGDVSGSTITANGSAIAPGSTSGSSLAINDTATEEGKTEDSSPTYKVTDNKDGSRSVTYEKPAKDAKGTEEIKAEVKLTDGNTYKVTEIAPSAFENFGGKDKITEIKVGDNVEKIGKGACKGMKNLKKLTLGDNIEIIDDSAFEGDKALTSLVIGKKVKKIGAKAYADCAKLKKITVKSAKLTKKNTVGKKAFWKINKKAKVKVKLTKKEAKSKAKVIKVFSNKRIGYEKTWKVN